MKNIFLEMEIEVCKSLITAQEKELEKVNNDWSQGFHEGLKLAHERHLEGLLQIQKEDERNESQRTSAESLIG